MNPEGMTFHLRLYSIIQWVMNHLGGMPIGSDAHDDSLDDDSWIYRPFSAMTLGLDLKNDSQMS